jgi:hypothetical protein
VDYGSRPVPDRVIELTICVNLVKYLEEMEESSNNFTWEFQIFQNGRNFNDK